jgi:hypothetical protein
MFGMMGRDRLSPLLWLLVAEGSMDDLNKGGVKKHRDFGGGCLLSFRATI